MLVIGYEKYVFNCTAQQTENFNCPRHGVLEYLGQMYWPQIQVVVF